MLKKLRESVELLAFIVKCLAFLGKRGSEVKHMAEMEGLLLRTAPKQIC